MYFQQKHHIFFYLRSECEGNKHWISMITCYAKTNALHKFFAQSQFKQLGSSLINLLLEMHKVLCIYIGAFALQFNYHSKLLFHKLFVFIILCNHCWLQYEPTWEFLDQIITNELQVAFSLDCLESSHPISVPVERPEEINQLFDTISYSKGKKNRIE